MATVADSPSAKQPREKSVVVLKTLVMAAGDSWELGCQAAADGSVTDSKTSTAGEALSAVLSAAGLSQLGVLLETSSDPLELHLPLLHTLGTVLAGS